MQPKSLGRYRVVSILGRGAMGVVYRGHDPVIDRPIALKSVVLPESVSDDERKTFLERFFLEARAAGKLTHPNVVVTYDAATDESTGIPFIAMELVDGDNLSDRLRSVGSLEWQAAVDLVIPLAEALAKAHDAGIVHRDIKPANIIMSAGDVPKIADFGIAKLPTSKLTQEGNVIGTPYFMSPEQLRGEPIDGRSDLFSLGALLYNLIAGRPPFEGSEPASIFAQTLYKEPQPLSELVHDLPGSLDRVVSQALAKNANERYRSGVELAEDLRAVRDGREPAGVRAHDEGKARKTLVSQAPADIPTMETSHAVVKPATLSAVSLPRLKLAGVVSAVVILAIALVFRSEIAREVHLWQAERAASRGELVESEAMLETLLDQHPELDRAHDLLAEVSAGLLEGELPIERYARHNHRFGDCSGNLTLTDRGVRFASREHGTWSWDFHQIRSMESGNEWRITLSTRENDMMGLLDSKRYVFELRSDSIPSETWKRYARMFEATVRARSED